MGNLHGANDSLPDDSPNDGPSGGPRIASAGGEKPRVIVSWAVRWRPCGATQTVSVRGGATPSSPGSRAPTPCRCRPLRRRRSPSLVQAHHDRPVSGAQRRLTIRERDTEGTASSFGDVPSHTPHAVPGSLQSGQRNQPLPRSLWVGLRIDSRGGSDAPGRRNRRSNSGRRLSPAGTSLPPRTNSQLENGRARWHDVGRSPRNAAHTARL